MNLVKLLLLISLATLLSGQLVRLPLAQGAITLSDLAVAATVCIFIFESLVVKKSLKIPGAVFTPFVFYTLVATASTVLAFDSFSVSQVAASSLFLLRFVAYFLICIAVYNYIEKKSIEKWLNALLVIGVIFAFFGFLQLVFFSDLSSLQVYGWDPHQMRLVSTLLDPNFSGSILSMLAAFALSFYLFKGSKIYLLALFIFTTAIILTFSRSSYLAIATVIATVGFIKAPKVLIIAFLASITVFLSVGEVKSRVIGALTIDETAAARIESWQKALTIFRDNPVIGVGFNTYRYAQANYGFFSFDSPLGGHSGAGSDSSILLIAATTGIIGLLFYLYLLTNIFRTFMNKVKNSALNLGALAAFLGLIVNSQFINSLFFPQVMLILFFVLGLVLKNDS